MTVTDNWIPFETILDKTIINTLTESSRRFTKGLRYNLSESKPLASVVLTDTAPLPTAMYILKPGADEQYVGACNKLIEESQMASWSWDASEFEMPEIPPSG